MDHINELISILNSNFNWNKARVTCFAKMLLALLVTRTVNLNKIACSMSGQANKSSRYRRLQRFFSEMTIDFEMIASFIFRLFFVTNGCWYLTMDRTNWIDGGGVDALLGEQTCVHKDLDIVTQEKNLEIFCASREILLFAYFLSRHR